MDRSPDISARPAAPDLLAVFLLSAAVIALELALMRCLAVARWHHFAYLVISAALLGFGASGTLLTFAGDTLRHCFKTSVLILTLAFALSVTGAFRAAEALPLNVRYVLYSPWQMGLMFAHDFLLLVPFFLAGSAIGLSLMQFGRRAHYVYGVSLIGSGAGSALAMGLMFLLPPHLLLYGVGALGALAGLCWAASHHRRPGYAGVGLVLVAIGAEFTLAPLTLKIDQYKDLALLDRLAAQGDARRVVSRYGPRGRLDVYASPLLHKTMFAGLTATSAPPAQLALLVDGDYAATVLDVESAAEAEILDHTPMSVPYRLLKKPRVLLLGEAGGTNVWLARRMGASHVTVVQPNPQIVDLMQGELADASGRLALAQDVTVVRAAPRSFLERTHVRFDLIQIVTTESLAAGASGLRSLHEDFLLTRQGLELCVRRLTPSGVVAATRGLQMPPRDNIKILATLRAALAGAGLREPERHLVQVRNLLAVTTIAFASPPDEASCERLDLFVRRLGLDVEWSPCAEGSPRAQRSRMQGPPGKRYSYLHHAALKILSGERRDFFRRWQYNVRPAADDSPYFYNFFRWKSLPGFWRAYGRQWFTKMELGYVVLVFALVQALLVGGVLILLPLIRLRRSKGEGGGRAATALYFTLLGLGFMMMEMVCLLKFTRLLGDPIYAAAGMLSSFLIFSGLGSVLARRIRPQPLRAIRLAAAGVALIAVVYALGLDGAFRTVVVLPLWCRMASAIVLTAPAAFLMGWPFPNGLAILGRSRPLLVPWAWAANGFAGVAASPLAVLLALHVGFRAVLICVAALYLAAALVSHRLPGVDQNRSVG